MGDSCRDQGAAAQVNATSNLTTLLHCAPSHSKTTVYRRWFHVYSPEFGRVYKRMTLDNLRATIYSIEGSQLTIGSAYGYWHMTRSTFLHFKRDVMFCAMCMPVRVQTISRLSLLHSYPSDGVRFRSPASGSTSHLFVVPAL